MRPLCSMMILLALSCASPVWSGDFRDRLKNIGAVPIPPAERELPTAGAERVFTAGTGGETLEGAIFDEKGNLLFCDVSGKRILNLSPDNAISTVAKLENLAPAGLALRKDGRLFIAALNLENGLGSILALTLENGKMEVIIPVEAGYLPNDLVMDSSGGFYFSDFKGSSTQPDGGVYYVSPDLSTITPVLSNLAQANGLALSPDGKTLWITEYAANRLHKVSLKDAISITPTGYKIPYTFIGGAPDSMRADADGNVYVAMMGQGRVLVFNPEGLPIAQVLLPEREKGLNLRSSSVALHPRKEEMRIVAGNTPKAASSDATIFGAASLAPGLAAGQ